MTATNLQEPTSISAVRRQRDELAAALRFLLRRAADWHEQGCMPSAAFETFPAVRQARKALERTGRA